MGGETRCLGITGSAFVGCISTDIGPTQGKSSSAWKKTGSSAVGGDTMKPVKFEQANRILSKPSNMTDDECSSLWVYSDGKTCISCWKMTWLQRIKALLFGRVWLGIYSGNTQPPVWLDCDKTVFCKE